MVIRTIEQNEGRKSMDIPHHLVHYVECTRGSIIGIGTLLEPLVRCLLTTRYVHDMGTRIARESMVGTRGWNMAETAVWTRGMVVDLLPCCWRCCCCCWCWCCNGFSSLLAGTSVSGLTELCSRLLLYNMTLLRLFPPCGIALFVFH